MSSKIPVLEVWKRYDGYVIQEQGTNRLVTHRRVSYTPSWAPYPFGEVLERRDVNPKNPYSVMYEQFELEKAPKTNVMFYATESEAIDAATAFEKKLQAKWQAQEDRRRAAEERQNFQPYKVWR